MAGAATSGSRNAEGRRRRWRGAKHAGNRDLRGDRESVRVDPRFTTDDARIKLKFLYPSI